MGNSDNSIIGEGEFFRQVFSAYIAAVFLSFVLCVCIFTDFFAARTALADFENVEIYGQINPNDAPVGSLVRLPGIGPSRAAAIVKYREVEGNDFTSADELANISGIGPKTVENVRRYLDFE